MLAGKQGRPPGPGRGHKGQKVTGLTQADGLTAQTAQPASSSDQEPGNLAATAARLDSPPKQADDPSSLPPATQIHVT